jgi:hypothetical protein
VAGLEADAGRTFGFSRVIARVLPVKADGNPSLP